MAGRWKEPARFSDEERARAGLAHGKALSGGFFDLTLSIIFIGTSVFSTSVIMSAIGA
jgi:hypothetical protein